MGDDVPEVANGGAQPAYEPGAPSITCPRKVAVIGAGVTGLGAAWHLSRCEGIEVTVLEARERAGGHANTIDLKLPEGEVSVDTGFMVFNDHNYPNMVRLFDELGVAGENTDMSFSVSLDERTQEWGSKGLLSLFARKRNIFSTEFHKMLSEMARFNREAPRLLLMEEDDPRKAVSVREYLKTNGYSEAFARLYLVPMAAALWSSTAADVMAHSALALISFFHNHLMLQMLGRPQWKTPAARSRQYVREICRRIGEDRIELGNPCVRVERVESPAKARANGAANGVNGKHNSVSNGNGKPHADKAERSRAGVRKEVNGAWTVTDSRGKARVFDEVVFACPADKALGLLGEEASAEERDALSRFKFSDNTIYVHSDEKLMPRRRAAWSSWNYLGKSLEIDTASAKGSLAETKPVFVTYWINQVFVTLNPHTPPESSLTHKVIKYRHPQFSPQAEAGQRILSRGLDGQRGLWFCGAWRGYGFHEDGLRSGLEAATSITGMPVPWGRGLPSPSPELRNASNSAPPATVTRDARNGHGPVAKQGLLLPQPQVTVPKGAFGRRVTGWARGLVEAVAVHAIAAFLRRTVVKGCLRVTYPDGRVCVFGDTDSPGVEDDDGTAKHGGRTISLKVYDWWFFVRVALEYDLGLARSYLAGEWELIGDNEEHDGLRQVFLFLIDNRDVSKDGKRGGMKARKLVTSWVGYAFNFLWYKLGMDNSISGARSNIAAHYDLSNELFKLFLDKRHMLYSCGIFQTEMRSPTSELLLTGSIEDAQGRKADALIRRARLAKHHYLLDIGFGWGGICIRAAETIGCRVHGITISKEQKALAEERVIARGLQHLITFELVDYRDFAKRHKGEFDRIISCEMIEAVGHNYLGAFFAACDALLAPDGVMVMQAITTPENRYEEYIKSTDFINTVIFPGSCCPSLNALLEAMAANSEFSLEGLDNISIHYARTLKDWRHRFNHRRDEVIAQGFDSAFIRCFNYYFTYCEAGFASRTEACLMLTFSRPGCAALDPNALTSALAR